MSLIVSAYQCPDGFIPGNLSYFTRDVYTLSQWGSPDDVNCALHKTQANCRKPNGRRKKWLTFTRGGLSTFNITKEALFSVTDPFANTTTTTTTFTDSTSPTFGGGSTSTSVVTRFFAIRTLSFRVRGAFMLRIDFIGAISQTVNISNFY